MILPHIVKYKLDPNYAGISANELPKSKLVLSLGKPAPQQHASQQTLQILQYR